MNLPCGLHYVEKRTCPALVVGLVLVAVLDIGFVVKAVDEVPLCLPSVVVGLVDGVKVILEHPYNTCIGVILEVYVFRAVVRSRIEVIDKIIVRLMVLHVHNLTRIDLEMFRYGFLEHGIKNREIAVVAAFLPRVISSLCDIVGA